MCITQSWACQYCIRIRFYQLWLSDIFPERSYYGGRHSVPHHCTGYGPGDHLLLTAIIFLFLNEDFSRKSSIFITIGDYVNVSKYSLFLDYTNIYCIFRFANLLRYEEWLHGSTVAFYGCRIVCQERNILESLQMENGNSQSYKRINVDILGCVNYQWRVIAILHL